MKKSMKPEIVKNFYYICMVQTFRCGRRRIRCSGSSDLPHGTGRKKHDEPTFIHTPPSSYLTGMTAGRVCHDADYMKLAVIRGRLFLYNETDLKTC